MSFKYGMICIVLFIIIFFLAIKSYNALTHPLEMIPDKGSAKRSEMRKENFAAMGVVKESMSMVSYHSIAEKNIFSPDRKDFPMTGPGSAMRPVVRPQVILYGVTIAGDYQSASVVNPGRPLKKGERDLITLRLGERIGEYKLTKVLSDRITLEAGGDAFEVLLYDPKAPKRREGGSTGTPSSVSTPTGTPRPFVRRDVAEGLKEPAQERTSPSQLPWPAPTPDQITYPMMPTPIPPSSFTSPPVIPPPRMGQPVSLPSTTPTRPPSQGGK
jgi:hypothetical protein